MAQSIQHDRYPKFVADQVLTEKSLNQMFGYLEEQQRLTRTTLIGIGIMCGMHVRVSDDGTSLTVTGGVGVTSRGYLVPFPETTYTFYNDEFSAEQEIFYEPFIDAGTGKQKFPLYLLHNNAAAEIKKPIKKSFLEDKAVVIFVELLKVDNKNCDPDTCDDKGVTIEVTHRPLLVDLDNLDELIFGGPNDLPFSHEPTCVEWPDIKMPRYNVPSTFILSSKAVLKNFLQILNSDFILKIENVLGAAYGSFGVLIKDEYPNNPFSGLRNKFKFLFDGSINAGQLLYVQYYYDFFSDLMLAYRELRDICNKCLCVCSPNEALFPRHLILGNAIPSPDEFRHHWIQSPAFSCSNCSEGQIRFLLIKIVLLIAKLDIPKNNLNQKKNFRRVRVTPSNYGDIPISDKAIPYYYDVVDPPDQLFDHWNFKKYRQKKGNTNLSYDASLYNSSPYISEPLNYDIEPYNFFRIEGHLGMNWKNALTDVNKIKQEKRLPFDVIALNGDIFELIRSLLTTQNSLADIIQGDPDLALKLHCYFADIESQYDAHASELRCTLLKVMSYFYNLKRVGIDDNLTATDKIPESDMVRKAFPNYRTLANSYGESFDEFYANVKNQPYITPQAFMASAGFKVVAGATTSQTFLLNPVYLMYYLEKIHEALPDGLVQLKINDLTQRLNDASLVATFMLAALDSLSEFELPALWEESLDAIIRICKAKVFEVIYRNFLINYALFVSNQSFAMYAFMNSGVQHKAGVTTGGTFILVYHDKQDVRLDNLTAGIIESEASTEFSPNENFTSTTNAGNENVTFAAARAVSRNPIMEYRKGISVKGLGLNHIFELVDAKGREDELTDAELAELVGQFPDGTVIADFFVPNMCKAACMPMNYIVLGDRETPPGEIDIHLDMKYREFCENDQGEYQINAAPEGGELKIDGNTVTAFLFKPIDFNPGDQPFREVAISYELDGNVKNIRVKVYNRPEVNIGIKNIDQANHIVEFTNDTKFADRYEWNFGNGQFSDKQDPGPINFGDSQTAVVTLKAFNGPCQNESQPLTIAFEEIPGEVRQCASIDELGELFSRLDEIGPDQFKSAIQEYPLLRTIFMEKFSDISGLPQEEQCKLLTAEIKVSVIQRIIRVLNTMIRNDKELRRFALMLFEILLNLTMFYACCQEKDANEAGVKTETTLKMMRDFIASWLEGIEFNDEERKIIESMLDAVKTELEKTISETPSKPVYIQLLKDLNEVLSQLLA